jgi:hypothetical protein
MIHGGSGIETGLVERLGGDAVVVRKDLSKPVEGSLG